MKKTLVSVAALLAISVGSASAADMAAKMYKKAPPIVAAFDPWDIAFGSAIMSNYVFRGITQSNGNKGSVAAYFEPRYNITKDVQLYVGVSGESIAFPNRASMELDGYFGIRPTWGAAAFDFGFFYYGYPGGQCFNTPAFCGNDVTALALPNGSVAKKDASFYEAYGKLNYTFNDYFTLGGTGFYSPNFLNTGANGTYGSVTGKVTAPSTWFGSSGVGSYVSGEFGRQWFGTSDAFYGNLKYADYNTWNVGVGFTYKVFTLDLRYSDTNMSKGDCNAFTSDFTAPAAGPNVTAINPAGGGSSWCGATGIVKLSADLTAMSNLK
ncbi:TorF family putative porin [soil metagenome]